MNTRILTTLLLAAGLPAVVSASSDMDNKIETAAENSYNFKTVLHSQVKVSVDDGVVTLTGTVDDSSNKDLAEDTVRNLPGVVKVDDQIQVDEKYAAHSDGWIAFKIKSTLLVRANVSASDTQVDVHNGVVTLTGRAQNQAQKELTTEYAKSVDDVKKVDNEMTVVTPPADQESMSENMDDASITTQVKMALLSHRSTSAVKTKVQTKNGVVTLSGEAANDAEKSLDTKLAEQVKGVRSVVNDIEVKQQ